MLSYCHLEILNTFIFELMFSKWSLMGHECPNHEVWVEHALGAWSISSRKGPASGYLLTFLGCVFLGTLPCFPPGSLPVPASPLDGCHPPPGEGDWVDLWGGRITSLEPFPPVGFWVWAQERSKLTLGRGEQCVCVCVLVIFFAEAASEFFLGFLYLYWYFHLFTHCGFFVFVLTFSTSFFGSLSIFKTVLLKVFVQCICH